MSRRAEEQAEEGNAHTFPHSWRLARLVLLPPFATARERLDDALGPELARFLVAALTAQGHVA